MLPRTAGYGATSQLPRVSAKVRSLSWTPKMRQVAKLEPCP